MLTKKETYKGETKSKTSKPSQAEYENYSSETQKPARPYPNKAYESEHPQPYDANKKGQKTRITIKYNVGYNNQLYIRGKGANLNWEKGAPLRNVKPDEWTWETDANFSHCEFKVLINDRQYETGENHYLTSGSSIAYTPHF